MSILRETVTVEPYGDSAVMVSISVSDPTARRREIVAFRSRLLARRPHGVVDVVSGLESLLVSFDPLVTSFEHVEYAARLLAELPDSGAVTAQPARRFAIPVLFDAEAAPDLDEVADELGLTADEVVERICRSRFSISLLAAAMAPMMDGLNTPRPVRRRAEPRTDVPAGSIMIAGVNAIIQPFPGPTGWRVIGRTPHTIVDIHREHPVSFGPGDQVRFTRIDRAEVVHLDGAFLTEEGTS